ARFGPPPLGWRAGRRTGSMVDAPTTRRLEARSPERAAPARLPEWVSPPFRSGGRSVATAASSASAGGATLAGSQGRGLVPHGGRHRPSAQPRQRGRAALQGAVPVGDVLEDEPAGHDDADVADV